MSGLGSSDDITIGDSTANKKFYKFTEIDSRQRATSRSQMKQTQVQDNQDYASGKSFMLINDRERLSEDKFKSEKQLVKIRHFVPQAANPNHITPSLENQSKNKQRSVVFANNFNSSY